MMVALAVTSDLWIAFQSNRIFNLQAAFGKKDGKVICMFGKNN